MTAVNRLYRALTSCTLVMISACSESDVGAMMERHLWKERVLLVFAPDLEQAQSQWSYISANTEGVKERDLALWSFVYRTRVTLNDQTQPHLPTEPFYRYYNIAQEQFMVTLLGKDGEIIQQWQRPVSEAEVFKAIAMKNSGTH